MFLVADMRLCFHKTSLKGLIAIDLWQAWQGHQEMEHEIGKEER